LIAATSRESSGQRVSVALLVVHALLAVAVAGAASVPFQLLVDAVREPVVLADEVVSPAWALPVLFAVVFLVMRLALFARGRRARPVWTWAVILALGTTVTARALEPEPTEVAFTHIQDAPPVLQTVEALKVLQTRLLDGLEHHSRVPVVAELEKEIRVDGKPLWPSYLYRFRRRPFHLVHVEGASKAIDRPRPGDLAGTLYLAIAPDQRHFWLTAVVLLEEKGHRSSDMLPAEQGIFLLTNAAE
jgi:hypothetical protein